MSVTARFATPGGRPGALPLALIQNAGAVAAGTLATAALGYAFWSLAARTFAPADVGFAAAFVSAMTLLGSIGVLGLGTFVIAEMTRHRGREAELIAAAMGGAGLVSVALGVVFAVVTPLLSPSLASLAAPLPMALFAGGVGLTAAGTVLDQALVGLLRPRMQFGRSLLFGGSKLIGVAIAGVMLKDGGGLAIAATWVGGAIVATAPLGTLFAERRARVGLVPQPSVSPLNERLRAVLGHHTLNVGLQFTHLSLPILVTIFLSATDNAYFYVAWMMASMVFVASAALTIALYAVGMRDRQALAQQTRFTLALGLGGGLAAMVVLFFASNFLLALLFGATYPEHAGPTLRILVGAACPLVIVDHFIALTRIHGRTMAAAKLVWPTAIGQLSVAGIGAVMGGLPGLSLAWVLGVGVEALLMTPYVLRITGLRLAWIRR